MNAVAESQSENRKPTSLHRLREMHRSGEKITMLTCYDATFARVLDEAGVDCLLVGDSLGMVLNGQPDTLQVKLQEIEYHLRSTCRGNRNAWVIGDLPFGSYHASLEQAISSATTLMQAGANMAKLEGGGWTVPIVGGLVQRGIPVCAHLGLTPQSVHALGGWRIQGKTKDEAASLVSQARDLRDAGASMLVLELVPSGVGEMVSNAIDIPVVGIGAGPHCGGQVLVLHDLLGLSGRKPPRFVKNFMVGCHGIPEAVQQFVEEVKEGAFPNPELHCYG